MSRTMQIDIRVLPAYGSGGLSKAYPSLARMLREEGRENVVEEEPSLYHLVEILERMAASPSLSKRWKETLTRHILKIKACRDTAREQLLARKLNDLDQTLYHMEDLFDDLEKDLAW